MVTNNMLYQNFPNALMQAKNYQSQISQKEFEMKLIDINSRYSSNNYYYNELQKQKIELEILTLRNNRNNIFNAIDYALELTQIEIRNNALYSMAYLAINSITSYLRIQKVSDLILPFHLQSKLTRVDTILMRSNTSNTMLKSAISELKNILHVF